MTLKDTDPIPARTGRRAAAALVAATAALALVGCGSDKDDSNAAADGSVVATAPSATTPPTDAAPATSAPEDQPGGAGDEEGVTVQASLLLDDDKVVPTVVKVPAFLPIELVVVSVEGVDRKVTVDTRNGEKKSFTVKALDQRTFNLPGLSKGDHKIYVDGKPQAKLDAGAG